MANDSEEENMSDDDEYALPPRIVEETDSEFEDDETDDIEIEYLEDETDDIEGDYLEDETDPLQMPSTSSIKQKSKTNYMYTWVDKPMNYDENSNAFLGCEDLPSDIMALETPFQFFKYIFPTAAFNLIHEQSQLFALQTTNSIERAESITRQDISKFIGVITYMSVVQLPSTRHYWKEGTYTEKVANCMTCNKFEEIKRFLHFFDKTLELKPDSPQFDKLQKIRPLLEILNGQLKKIPREEHLAIDEQMIPTKARTSGIRQYNAKKPHKWGYLNYVLSGASGFSYDFDIFTGKHSSNIPENCPDLGATGNVVTRLLDSVPKHLNHKLFIDNWYTSLKLVAHLHSTGILTLGTIQLNRAKGIDLPTARELMKKERGFCMEKSTEVNGVEINVTTWVDNKVVNLCSSYVGKEPMATVKRYSKQKKERIDVPRPKAIEVYNKYMGGVDLLDSMLGFYRIKVRSKKWYHRIFFHMVDMAIVNSWLLWRRKEKQKGSNLYMPLLDFKLYIADVLMRESAGILTPTTRKRGRPANDEMENIKKIKKRRIELPPAEIVEDGSEHWPLWDENRQRCKWCGQKTYIRCEKCECHYCLNKDRNCFKPAHKK